MAFSCPEFPGLVFGSISELGAMRQAQASLREKLAKPVIVTLNKELIVKSKEK
jgi:hypothetical protein